MMAKKIHEAEAKKECPSCGLAVALDATICEFCGWDFEEEDEWILQIEKLERDLMLERKKFEPGSVDEKIELTLHAPVLERSSREKEAITKPRTGIQPSAAGEEARAGTREAAAKPEGIVPEEKPIPQAMQTPAPAAPATPQPVKSAPTPAAPRVRRVRTVKAAPAPEPEPVPAASQRAAEPTKTRVVRKLKSR